MARDIISCGNAMSRLRFERFPGGLARFHAHLDSCADCRANYFDLCPTGSRELEEAATGRPTCDVIELHSVDYSVILNILARAWSGGEALWTTNPSLYVAACARGLSLNPMEVV